MHCRKWSVAVFVFLIAARLVSSAQTITSVSPNPAPAGATISIAGTGFGAQGAGSILTVNGSTFTFATWSPTLITAVVPSNAILGSYSVGVTANGVTSNTETLTVVGAPTITSLSPNSAAPGGTVTIAGNNFGSPESTSELTVNGSSFSWSTWSNTAITAVSPAGVQSGSAVVGVTVGGVASNTMTETFQPVAQVTGGFAQSSVRVLQVAANATPGKATIVVTSGSASAQATFTVAAPLGCPAS